MPLVQVPYTVPVIAIVDTDTEEVRRVITIDEEIKMSDEMVVADDGILSPVELAIDRKARKIAEDAESWPVWEAGR